MMTISEIIKETLNNRSYKTRLAASFGSDKSFVCSDNRINESLFLLFIKMCGKDKELFRIFENINHLLIVEKNITDKVFFELVKFAKEKKKERWWVFLNLCHANLKPEHTQYLKSLKFLNESFFY